MKAHRVVSEDIADVKRHHAVMARLAKMSDYARLTLSEANFHEAWPEVSGIKVDDDHQ